MSRATLVCLIVFVTVCSMSRATLVYLIVFVTVCSMSRATLMCLIVFVILLMAGLIAGILVGINRDDIGLKRNRYGSRKYCYTNVLKFSKNTKVYNLLETLKVKLVRLICNRVLNLRGMATLPTKAHTRKSKINLAKKKNCISGNRAQDLLVFTLMPC